MKKITFINFVTIVTLITSCNVSSLETNWSEEDYLDISVYDFSFMSEEDYDILNRAESRLTFFEENGQTFIYENSGKQVNISERLFRFIKSNYTYTNSLVKGTVFPRTKIVTEGASEYPDCLFYAILNTGSSKKNNPTYSSIESYVVNNINNRWYDGDGFSGAESDDIVDHFVEASPYPVMGNLSIGNLSKYIMIIPSEYPNNHAVNAVRIRQNGSILRVDYKDYWKDHSYGQSGSIAYSSVLRVYY